MKPTCKIKEKRRERKRTDREDERERELGGFRGKKCFKEVYMGDYENPRRAGVRKDENILASKKKNFSFSNSTPAKMEKYWRH